MTSDARLLVPEGVGPPVSIPAAVFVAALHAYVSEQRLDMKALAGELCIGRATLYRWAGNRESLLDELVWFRSRKALVDAADATAGESGVARLVSMITKVLRCIEVDRPLHAILASDPEMALRICTGTHSRCQQGMTSTLERLIDLEIERGHFGAELDTPTLAYAIVRISEGFLYSDIIADRSPDIERAGTVIEGLLRGLDTTSRLSPLGLN